MKKTYWHATPAENLASIMVDGLKPGFGGLTYFSDDPVKSAIWMCFTRRDAREVYSIPFEIEESLMELGIDHSPMMTQMLGIDDEGSSFTYSHGVLSFREHSNFDGIRVFQNTFAMSDDDLEKLKVDRFKELKPDE